MLRLGLLILVVCFVSGTVARLKAINVYTRDNDNHGLDIGAEVKLGRALEVDFRLNTIYEVRQSFVDQIDEIPFGDSDIETILDDYQGLRDASTSFSAVPSEADTYQFLLLNQTLAGRNLTIDATRLSTKPNTYFFLRYAQPDFDVLVALLNPRRFGYGPGGRRNLPAPQYLCPRGINKLELAIEWPPRELGWLLVHFDVTYKFNFFQNFWGTRRQPDVKAERLLREDGSLEGIKVRVKGAGTYKIRFPDFPILVLDGVSRFPPYGDENLTPVDDVDIQFRLYSGPHKSERNDGDVDGVIPLYVVVSATNITNGEPVPLGTRIVIDPVVDADSSASPLNSWLSYFF